MRHGHIIAVGFKVLKADGIQEFAQPRITFVIRRIARFTWITCAKKISRQHEREGNGAYVETSVVNEA